MRRLLLSILLLSGGALAQTGRTEAIRSLEGALAEAVDAGAIMMQLAEMNAAAGDEEAALKWLRKAADLHQGFRPSAKSFNALRGNPEFAAIEARIARDNPPVERGRVVFTAPWREIVTEGLAADAASRSLFIGSLNRHTVYRIGRGGKWTEFVPPGSEGLDRPLGMQVAGGSLYVCNNADGGHSVMRFALDSGRLIQRWELAGSGDEHLLNDLAVDADGTVYVTDSYAGDVYRGLKDGGRLASLDLGRRFHGANGIALAPGRRIYVSCFPDGVALIDLETRTVRPLARPAGVTLAAIDGLYLRGRTLVGIQNYLVADRVVAWKLNPAGDAVTDERILARGGARLEDPTTGAFLGDRFYFIANSGIPHWDKGKVSDPRALRPTAIIELTLPRR